jgi:hypothetical protein
VKGPYASTASAQVETKWLGKTRSLDFDKLNPGVSIRSSLRYELLNQRSLVRDLFRSFSEEPLVAHGLARRRRRLSEAAGRGHPDCRPPLHEERAGIAIAKNR